MTKRIFHAILLVTLATLSASTLFILAVLFPYFENKLTDELVKELTYLSYGVEQQGIVYLQEMSPAGNRLTLIGPDGTVLYDNMADASQMENHADREEVKEALAGGIGRSVRQSRTLSKNAINCAILLPSGNVLRVSSMQYSSLALLLSLIEPILLILAFTAVLSAVFAYRVSRYVTQPLNRIDLERPPVDDPLYQELTPLLRRIAHQNRQIKAQMQESLRQQQQFTAITENMQEGFLVLDAAGKVLSHNSSAARLLKAPLPLLEQDLRGFTPCEEFSLAVQDALDGHHVESLIPLHGRICQLFANPVFQDDLLTGTVLVLLDVTEQQQREALRREFSANVSHELKTPLTSISGIAEIMGSGLMSPDDMPHFAGKIYDESQRLIQLVQDILRLSQLDENSILDQPVPVDLHARAQQIARQLESTAQSQQVRIVVEGESAKVNGIPAILDEILFNLCENAIKYNRPGGAVTLSTRRRAGQTQLTVADTGIGIPAEHHSRVFERFYRVDKSHSKEIGGTGLGLSIVKHGAAFHHAHLELESTPGVGTTIRLTFPAFE